MVQALYPKGLQMCRGVPESFSKWTSSSLPLNTCLSRFIVFFHSFYHSFSLLLLFIPCFFPSLAGKLLGSGDLVHS